MSTTPAASTMPPKKQVYKEGTAVFEAVIPVSRMSPRPGKNRENFRARLSTALRLQLFEAQTLIAKSPAPSPT